MTSAVEELVLRITGDSRSGEEAIRRVQKAWSGLGRYLRQNKDQIGQAADQMRRAEEKAQQLTARLDQTAKAGRFLGVVFGGLAAAGGKLIQSTARVAMRNEILALSLYVVGENAGYSRAEMDALTEQVKGLGITTSQARLGLTRMVQSQLDLAEATNLASTAQDLAVIAGENSSETFGNLMEAVTSLQPRLLRQYGIVATTNQILGDLSDSTDATAKRNKMLQFVLGEGSRVAGVYSEAMGVVGKRITSIPRLLEEAKAAFGKHFLPIIGMAVDVLSQLLKWFERLPEGVQQALAMMVLFGTGLSAVLAVVAGLMAALPMIISGIGAVSAALSPLLPVLAGVAVVIGALISAGALLALAWKKDWGGIRTAIEEAWKKITPRLSELIALVRLWGEHIALQAKRIWNSVTTLLQPVFEKLAALVRSIDLSGMFDTLMDAFNVAGNYISAWLDTINRLLRGEGLRAFSSLEDAAIDGLTLVALVFDKYISKALVWGWNLVVNVANGITKAAQTILVKAAQMIGNVLSRFLAPGSPPKEGPLSKIAEWGKGVMNTFLQSFALADFGMMREALSPIRAALEGAVQAGDLDEAEFGQVFGQVREQVAGLISEFRKTGEISESTLGQIAETLGEGSEEYVKFLRLQLEHRQALDDLSKVHEEVADAEAKGFIPAHLKQKLQIAEDAANAAKEELDWQSEYLAMQQESVDLQQQLVDVLDRLGDAMDKASSGADAGGGAGLAEALGLGDLGDAAAGLDALSARLGEMTPEFAEMRKRVVEWIARFREFLALPTEKKLMSIAQYLSDATGIDFAGFLQGIFDIANQIEEEGLLAVIEEWIQTGLDYIEENHEEWGEVINDFLATMFDVAIGLLVAEINSWALGLEGVMLFVLARYLQLLIAQQALWALQLLVWFGGIIRFWIDLLQNKIPAWSNSLKSWMGSLIASFVAKAIGEAASWAAGLVAIGYQIVARIKEGVNAVWDMAGFIGGKLSGLAKSILSGAWLAGFLSVGKAIVKNLQDGFNIRWDEFWESVRRKLEGLSALFPWSEPKDSRSPLRGLADSGRAIAENLAAGIDFSPVLGALQVELARTQRMLDGATGAMGGVNIHQTFEGGINFPNVRDGRDALGVRRELDRNTLRASMAARTAGV